jgi:hypothetical protein
VGFANLAGCIVEPPDREHYEDHHWDHDRDHWNDRRQGS